MFKIALVQIFRENELILTSHDSVEQIPVAIKEPRFKQTYFGQLRRLSQDNDKGFGPSRTLQYDAVKSSKSHKGATLVGDRAVDRLAQPAAIDTHTSSSSSEPVLKAGIK